MILGILVIVASWIFNMPLEWSITLTIFASIEIFVSLIRFGKLMSEKE